MRRRLVVFTLLVVSALPATASADWIVTPFVAAKFGGDTCPCPLVSQTLADPENAAGLRKFAFGGSFGLLTDGVLGAEADFAYLPGYFDRAGALNTVVASSMLTLAGELIIAVPAAVSRDGLRPYLIAGVGLLRASRETLLGGEFDVTSNRLALNIGGGAMGRLSNRTSLRFELRQVRDLAADEEQLELTFWRAGIGLTIRY